MIRPALLSLADHSGESALVGALTWVQGTLLGTLATSVAIFAIASIGFMMLSGRIDLRHGIRMILGSFILFGASAIAAGIQGSFAGLSATPEPASIVPAYQETALVPPSPPPANTDPYAGASVPSE